MPTELPHTPGNTPPKLSQQMNGDLELNKMSQVDSTQDAPKYYTSDQETKSAQEPLRGSVQDHDTNMDNKKELTVLYKGDSVLTRKRSTLEKYLAALCALLFVSCLVFIVLAATRSTSSDHSNICITKECVTTAAQLLEAIDQSADPCENFFQFACGAWNRQHTIPADKSSYNMFEQLHDELQIKLKRLLEEEIKEHDTQATLKAKVLYKSCIDTDEVERVGDEPLKNVLTRLGGWPVVSPEFDPSNWTLEVILGHLRGHYNAPVLLRVFVDIDDKNSSVRVIQLDQPSLGMPSREYYLGVDAYRNAYLRYMVSVTRLLGANESFAQSEMAAVLQFESQLANVTTPQNQRHDTGAMYTKISIRELQQRVPGINWLQYFNAFMPEPLTEDEPVVSFAMDYLKSMAQLIQLQEKRVLANYLLWRLIMGLAPELTEKFQVERNEYRRVMQGVSRDKVRWQKCVEYVNERMGMSVGRLFIHENFKKESKETALEMIHNIRTAFNEILMASDWMDEVTKKVAKEKANAMNERIGYPEFILSVEELDKTYDGLEFKESTYFENILNVERHDAMKNLQKLRKQVQKDKWDQDPAVVNAFYNPNRNDIVFPAGILQPLFYSQYSPKSMNYGGIGVVIGHEITHGFDDKGRQYDKDGNLRQWWSNDTIEVFRERAKCMIDQYSNFTLDPFGLQIDGKNTQGENIADNGGLKESFRAYRKWVEVHGEEQSLPGINLTHNQLFFLNYAQIWCGIMRGEEAIHKIRTSVHSPGPIRVLGPLSNSYDFAEAYNCRRGSPMNPVHKCAVW